MRSESLIFVPTYNESENVENMVAQLLELPVDADLLFLDDNSPDGTGDILDKLAAIHPRLTVAHRNAKLGIGSAHLEGIRTAYERGYKQLITLDCDFTHSPTDVIRLKAQAGRAGVVVGSRYMSADSLPGWNLFRRLLTGFGHLLTRRLLRIPFDATGALRVYDLERIPKELFELVRARGYAFFFESMFVLVRNGIAVKEVPIVLPARTYGSSKMTTRETLRSGLRVLSVWRENAIAPSRFRIDFATPAIDPAVGDDVAWNAYWNSKSSTSARLYDLIATAYRVSVIRSQLRRCIRRSFVDGSHLLHAGAGSGQVDEGLHGRLKITAVDISSAAVRLYRANNPDAFEVRHATILNLPFSPETFDGVYNLGVLEHFDVSDINRILREFHRVLKTDGKLVVFWPHAHSTSVAVLRAAHQLMKGIGMTTEFHPPEVSLVQSRSWVRDVLREAGFDLEHYSFGPRDFFVQAVVVAKKTAAAR